MWNQVVGNQARHDGTTREAGDGIPLPALRRLAGQIDIYSRYIRAGREIERLLGLNDAQLAARKLKRTDVGRTILARHGLGPDADV